MESQRIRVWEVIDQHDALDLGKGYQNILVLVIVGAGGIREGREYGSDEQSEDILAKCQLYSCDVRIGPYLELACCKRRIWSAYLQYIYQTACCICAHSLVLVVQ